MTRAQIFAEWKAAGVVTNDGLSMRTDEQVEQLYFTWVKAGSPRGAHVSIDFASQYFVDASIYTTSLVIDDAPELET